MSSTKGVFTALSGAMAQSTKLETIANNIANVNTPSFKRDQQLFKEYLTANEKPPSVIQVPKIPGSIESFYDMQGGDKSFVDTNGTYTDFSQGGLKSSGNPLDVAIDGKGFFEVATPQGVRLTRHGSFTLDGNGQMVTHEGLPVLLQGTGAGDESEVSSRVIRTQSLNGISIAENGDVRDGDALLGRLSVVDVDQLDGLQKVGNSLYQKKPNFVINQSQVTTPNLKQGFLETSNVNIVQEMTDMITTSRNFETAQKAIQAYDSMTERLVNQVPKTS